MKLTITALFALLYCTVIFSQDMFIKDSPYDIADEQIKSRNSFQREKWFYEQRMFPNNKLPDDAYSKAIEQRDLLRQQSGFFNDNSVSWIPLGPTPGYYFAYTNISGRTSTVKYDPVNPNVIYIGCAFGGVWKSTNAGVNWTAKSDFEVSLSSGSITVDPNNSNIVYYGTGEATYSGASYYGRGILKSVDAGNTWVSYTTGLPNLSYCSRIIVKKSDSNILFAAMGVNGLYKSTDAGQTWSIVTAGRCDDVVSSPTSDTIMALGSGVGFQRSTNGGTSFTPISGLSLGTRNHLAICRNFPNILYMSTYAGSTIRVYKSTDAGLTFTQVSVGTNFSGGQAWYDFYMHVNPFDPNYAYVGSIDIWRTTDGGNTFNNITNGYAGGPVHVDQQNMDLNPLNPDELIAANDGGVWKSTNRGTNWINLNNDISVTQFYRITSDPSNSDHLAGGTQDNGTQRTLGTQNWSAGFGGDGGEVCFQSQQNNFVLGETQNNGIYKSQSGGNGWFPSAGGLTGTGAWVGPILSHPTLPDIFYTARQQVFKSSDNGSLWVPISSGTAGVISEMAISRTNPDIMYATSNFLVFKSTNGGVTFTSIPAGPARTITSINIHPDSSQVAIMSYSGFGAGKVYKTTNGGLNWVSISGNLPDSPCNDAMFYYPGSATSTIIAAMDVGVFISTDWGSTWQELAQGLPNTVAMHLDYHQTSGKLRIGTHGRGTWEATGIIGIVNYSNETPADYSLSQNYPNPFNPVTNIKYQVLKQGYVKLSVYDILGRETKALVSKVQNPGTYTFQFDASGLSSGVYFYKLTAGEFTQTRKMMVVK
jgi:photosystem II stability/assembly factor-like uncharacterized protein